jgi:GTP1/Obg family GTP-binding protein
MAAKVKLKKPPAIDSRICIFVGGDPGVGKSTLVKHLESSDRGEEVLPPTIMSTLRT